MKKQVAMFAILVLSTVNTIQAEALLGSGKGRSRTDTFPTGTQAQEFLLAAPETEQANPWKWPPLEIEVSGSLEITSITAYAGGVLLITGRFSGTLYRGRDQAGTEGENQGFVMVMTPNGHGGEPRLFLCEPGLIPRRAWPAGQGFQILAEDFFGGHPSLYYLPPDGLGREPGSLRNDRIHYVTQPEDLPEGTGG